MLFASSAIFVSVVGSLRTCCVSCMAAALTSSLLSTSITNLLVSLVISGSWSTSCKTALVTSSAFWITFWSAASQRKRVDYQFSNYFDHCFIVSEAERRSKLQWPNSRGTRLTITHSLTLFWSNSWLSWGRSWVQNPAEPTLSSVPGVVVCSL